MSSLHETQTNPPQQQSEQKYIRFGWFVIALGLCGSLLWAGFAPLDQGVPTSGTVTVSGYRKVVQAPAGGVIAEILVRDGDKVSAGEPLLKMNRTVAQAKYDRLRTNYINALAACPQSATALALRSSPQSLCVRSSSKKLRSLWHCSVPCLAPEPRR